MEKAFTGKGANPLRQATAKAASEPGGNSPILPEKVVMDGNTYKVLNDGRDRSYRLVAETVTFNGVPGTPIEEVRALAEATGSKMIGRDLRWGTIAFADALKSGEIKVCE